VSRIFINYRREDALTYADRLQETLSEHYGTDEVFRDVDAIEPGVDFVDAIDRALSRADVMLVLIGPHWLVSRDGRRRLHDPEDYVCLEIAAGLTRPNVRVIPVLVGGSTMPTREELPEAIASLTRRHAFEMTDSRWRSDRDALLHRLDRVFEVGTVVTGADQPGDAEPPPAPTAEPVRQPDDRARTDSVAVVPQPPGPVPGAAEDHKSPSSPSMRRNRRWIAAIVAASLLAAGIAVGAVLLLGDDSSGQAARRPAPDVQATTEEVPAISVPDVVGETQEEAEALLEEQGFEVSSTSVPSFDEQGTVLSHDPPGGEEADEGSVIRLEVSNGPQATLLTMVPNRLRSSCTVPEADSFPTAAVAKVRCSTPNGKVAVQYNAFMSEGEMTEAYTTSLRGVENELGRAIQHGDCERAHVAKGSYTIGGATAGRVFCYTKDGQSWIEWTDTSLLVYSYAVRDDLRDAQLYSWWISSGGPVRPDS
jgi:hypothetical protein